MVQRVIENATTFHDMDPYRLRLLRELGEHGSVAAVAAAVGVTPSAVSQQLAILQDEAGVVLTEREDRRLVLTPAGRALAAAAVSVAKALAEADAAIEDFLMEESAPVRVCAFHSAALAFFGRLLATGGKSCPHLHLFDQDVAWTEFPRLTSDYDLVIAHRLPHQPDWPNDWITAHRIVTEPIDIVMSPRHELTKRPVLSAADLADRDWVAVHDGYPLRGVLDQIGSSAGAAMRVVHQVNDFSVAAEIVRTTDALAIMPRIAGLHLESAIERRPVSGLRLQRNIEVLARPEKLERAAVQRTLEMIHRVARDYVVTNHG